MTTLAEIQRRVGVTPDGKWGPNTAAAIMAALDRLPANDDAFDATKFFSAIRASVFGGSLSSAQVEGLDRILVALVGLPLSYAAYALATAAWETNKTMQPVREAYWLSEAWRKANLRYYPHYGRGYVQITWPENYAKADDELSLDGALVKNLDMALRPDIAAAIMRAGMVEGWFTGKKLADYLPQQGEATAAQFTNARRVINGTDKAVQIAALAVLFQNALVEGSWA